MIIVVTKQDIRLNDVLIVNTNLYLASEYSCIIDGKSIDFDYLITDDYQMLNNLECTKMLLDDGLPVTNCFGQTSLEHIYYGDIKEALNHLYYGE